jgi:hypothetical protein
MRFLVTRTSILVSALCFLAPCCPRVWAHAAERPPERTPAASVTLPEIRRTLSLNSDFVKQWYAEYRNTDPVGRQKGVYRHRRVALRSDGGFYHWNAHGSPSCNWPEDPFQQRLYIVDGDRILERPFSREYERTPIPANEGLPDSARNEPIFLILGWWPPTTRVPPRWTANSPIMLVDVAKDERYCLRHHQELVSGVFCHVIESEGRDRIWFDHRRGMCIVRRELLDPETKSVIRRLNAYGVRQLSEGMWVPTGFTFDVITPSRSSEPASEQVAASFDTRIVDLRINSDVPQDAFEFTPMSGSMHHGRRGNVEQVGRAEEYVDQLVAWCKARQPAVELAFGPTIWKYEQEVGFLICSISFIFMIRKWRENRARGRAA